MPINVVDKKTGEIVAGPKKGNTTREVGKMKGRDGKMGGHWSSEERREISTMRKSERQQEEVSKMRPTCKSHTDDKGQKASAVRRKRAAGNPGGKPTNVATFAKRKRMAFGGRV